MALMNKELVLFRARRALLLIGPTVSLIVSPWTNYDPISVVKVLALTTITFFVSSLVFSLRKELFIRIPKTLPLLCAAFLVFMVSTLLFSGAPLTQQIWGMFGRNTGFVTYFSLLLMMLSTALLADKSFLRNLSWSLIYTSAAATSYAIIQVMGRDPIRWSEMRPFATFGNINFSSAFFGMSALVAVILATEKSITSLKRFALLALAITDLAIIGSTTSIQGVMIFAAGIVLAVGLFLLKSSKLKLLSIPYAIAALVGFFYTVLALLNKGFLARFIYQDTIIFREDYMHAGWEMTLKRPFFGVGLDSYGDWYRALRGSISTLRTGPDRIANTAHNIFLDISSTGGIPLITVYLGIIIYALISSLRHFRKLEKWDPIFVALFCGWAAYQIQALISINQVAVGVWGWLFTGALIGYSNSSLQETTSSNSKAPGKKSRRNPYLGKALPIGLAFQTFALAALGFFIAVIPVNADAKFRAATQSGALEKFISATKVPGITAFHLTLAADRLRNSGLKEQTSEVLARLTKEYPRDYYAWRVIAFTDQMPERRSEALAMLKELDPFNPENK